MLGMCMYIRRFSTHTLLSRLSLHQHGTCTLPQKAVTLATEVNILKELKTMHGSGGHLRAHSLSVIYVHVFYFLLCTL